MKENFKIILGGILLIHIILFVIVILGNSIAVLAGADGSVLERTFEGFGVVYEIVWDIVVGIFELFVWFYEVHWLLGVIMTLGSIAMLIMSPLGLFFIALNSESSNYSENGLGTSSKDDYEPLFTDRTGYKHNNWDLDSKERFEDEREEFVSNFLNESICYRNTRGYNTTWDLASYFIVTSILRENDRIEYYDCINDEDKYTGFYNLKIAISGNGNYFDVNIEENCCVDKGFGNDSMRYSCINQYCPIKKQCKIYKFDE